MQSVSRAEYRFTVGYAVTLAALVALYRVYPYYVGPLTGGLLNFAPVGALALFAGSRVRGWFADLIPLGAMLASDLLLIRPLAAEGYAAFGWSRLIIYGLYVGYVLVGRLVGPRDLSGLKLGAAALAGGLPFFLVTNFLVWTGGSLYPRTVEGLLECYTMALPFYGRTVSSDLIFTAVVFGLHAALVWGWDLVRSEERQAA